jgi:hypothetical protein
VARRAAGAGRGRIVQGEAVGLGGVGRNGQHDLGGRLGGQSAVGRTRVCPRR